MPKTYLQQRPCLESLESRKLLASAGVLLQYDFNGAAVWPSVPGNVTLGVTATQTLAAAGTIDVQGSTTKTGAAELAATSSPAGLWTSELTSGILVVTNTESNLAKLTLSFMLSSSQVRPVTVRVFSYTTAGVKTGGLETVIYPPAADTFQRYALDLSTMTPSGPGTYNPTATRISFSFEMSSQLGWTTASTAAVRVDNFNFAKPAYYVSPTGSNNNNGLTDTTPFQTPQKALDASQPGDIILMMNGTYNNATNTNFRTQFKKGGTPANWVTLKNFPGHSPLILNEWWNAILVGNGTSASPASGAAVAYVEVRGLTIRGNAATANTTYAAQIGLVDPRTNGNGLTVDGRFELNRPHDIRFADNLIEYCCGGGISAQDFDRIQVENNTVRNNCWWMIYAGSGISIFSAYQYDGTTNVYSRVVRNNYVSGNECFQKWAAIGAFSDGNGIIVDVNKNTQYLPTSVFNGRTLVQSNVCFDNGGSGIHSYKADHTDIISNTAYFNSASPELQYGQIFINQALDCKVYNNILVARVANTGAGEAAEPVNNGTASFFRNNIYFGGNISPVMGTGDAIGDPKFFAPSIDPALANFQLQPTSPAINTATGTGPLPIRDFAGNYLGTAPDKGAFQYVTNLATTLATSYEFSIRQALTFNFNQNASPIFSSADYSIRNLTTGATLASNVGTLSFNGAGTTATLVLTNLLADGNYRLTYNSAEILSPTGVVTSVAPITFDFYSLGADANQDRRVDTVDFNVLLSNFGGTGKTFSQGNFNYDAGGTITSTDFAILVSKFGTSLPAIPAALPLALPGASPSSAIFASGNTEKPDSPIDGLPDVL